MSFFVVDLDDPGTVRASAQVISNRHAAVDAHTQGVSSGWDGICQSYEAPESGEVQAAMKTPKAIAAEVQRVGQEAASALRTYASDLDALKARRQTLLTDIAAFEADAGNAKDMAALEEREKTGDDLNKRCEQLARDKDLAQNACQAALGGIKTSASTPRGQQVPQRRASEGGTEISDNVFYRFGQSSILKQNSLPDGFSEAVQGFGLASFGVGTALTISRHRMTRVQPRAGWMPKPLQHLAGRSARASSILKGLTGWDKSLVKNGGWFLKANSPMNPFRKVSGLKQGAQALLGRTIINLKDVGRIANSGKANAVSKVGTASKFLSRAGSVVTAATSFYGSWQEDSRNHSQMGSGEKATRAILDGGATTVGAIAGAKGGAAIGAAVGSFIPGAGTAVGAIVGGVVGGFIGSEVGGKIGDTLKSGFSSLKNKIFG